MRDGSRQIDSGVVRVLPGRRYRGHRGSIQEGCLLVGLRVLHRCRTGQSIQGDALAEIDNLKALAGI